MGKEWTDEEIEEAIRDAVRIVREDKFEHFVRGKLGGATPPKDGPAPPPAKDGPTEPPKPPKKGIWWGDQLEDPNPDKESQNASGN